MNSTEKDERRVQANENDGVEEIEQEEKEGKRVVDQNGKEEKSVQEEMSQFGEKVKGERLKNEDKVDKVEENVAGEEENSSRLSDRGKPWISTIYNTGTHNYSSSVFLIVEMVENVIYKLFRQNCAIVICCCFLHIVYILRQRFFWPSGGSGYPYISCNVLVI